MFYTFGTYVGRENTLPEIELGRHVLPENEKDLVFNECFTLLQFPGPSKNVMPEN